VGRQSDAAHPQPADGRALDQASAVPYRLLFPAIFVFCCIGVYTVDGKIFDVYAIVR
jgi:TctA family transporter